MLYVPKYHVLTRHILLYMVKPTLKWYDPSMFLFYADHQASFRSGL